MQKTETSERAHAQPAGSPQGGNKAPPTPAPKPRAEKRAAERDNKKLLARCNRNGPSKRGHVHYAAYERAMRAAHERKVARADWFGLRRAENRARKALVASVVNEAGGVTLADVETGRARRENSRQNRGSRQGQRGGRSGLPLVAEHHGQLRVAARNRRLYSVRVRPTAVDLRGGGRDRHVGRTDGRLCGRSGGRARVQVPTTFLALPSELRTPGRVRVGPPRS